MNAAPKIRSFQCEKHGSYQGRQIPNALRFACRGDFFDPVCPECDQEHWNRKKVGERLERAKTRQAWAEKQIGQAGIAKRFRGKDFDGYQAGTPGQKYALDVARRYSKTLKDRVVSGDCLIFCGGPGTGKSHLASAIVQIAIQATMTAMYLTVMDLVLVVRATYHQKAEMTLRGELKAITDLDLLVIDEVGQQVGREDHWLLFHLIDTRYRMQKPVILISNLNRPGLTEYLGERAMDRMSEGAGVVVPFDWASHR